MKQWESEHPNWENSDTETQLYMELVQKIMGGANPEERERNRSQIKKCIGKNIILDK